MIGWLRHQLWRRLGYATVTLTYWDGSCPRPRRVRWDGAGRPWASVRVDRWVTLRLHGRTNDSMFRWKPRYPEYALWYPRENPYKHVWDNFPPAPAAQPAGRVIYYDIDNNQLQVPPPLWIDAQGVIQELAANHQAQQVQAAAAYNQQRAGMMQAWGEIAQYQWAFEQHAGEVVALNPLPEEPQA